MAFFDFFLPLIFIIFLAHLEKYVESPSQLKYFVFGWIILILLGEIFLSKKTDLTFLLIYILSGAPLIYLYLKMVLVYSIGSGIFLWLLVVFLGGLLTNIVHTTLLSLIINLLGINTAK